MSQTFSSVPFKTFETCIRTVPIRLRDYNAADPHVFSRAVSRVRNDLVVYGAYAYKELPGPLHVNHHIWQYAGQITSGGHEQFVANCGWSRNRQDELDTALGAIGATAHQQLFREVAAYINSSDAILADVMARGGFDHPEHGCVDPWLINKDNAFRELIRDQDLMALLCAWLKQHPAIQPVHDLQWKFSMSDLIEDNPLREARLAKSGQANRSFLKELTDNAPMKMTRHEYAASIAKRHGIELPRLAQGIWKDVINGEECLVAHYVKGKEDFVAIYSRSAAGLYQLRKKLFGQGLTMGRKLGIARIEYKEV
ncbi:hypothetical protein SAMN05216198_1381 [Halopseudomonas litoralis]|uniref:DNA mimic protein DMP19 C-terminal domain-containing protein n=1 Tax=Halopseudomonas litoralis TaxID=797277 RepID=A0A1H1Q4D9_9GAMM|nr:hypothetical protein [Halopseudomonas litoralis]SDS18368.1 hypothetical protein SAMN05216198_1381 [Halopseudomonas litoralis]